MDYYDFSKQGGLWRVQNSTNQNGPRCFYSWNYKGQLWVLVWFGDCSLVDWCGSNVGNCMGVEQNMFKTKNLSFVILFSCGTMPSLFTKHVLWWR